MCTCMIAFIFTWIYVDYYDTYSSFGFSVILYEKLYEKEIVFFLNLYENEIILYKNLYEDEIILYENLYKKWINFI